LRSDPEDNAFNTESAAPPSRQRPRCVHGLRERNHRRQSSGNRRHEPDCAITALGSGVQKVHCRLGNPRLTHFTAMKNLYHSLLLLIAGSTQKELASQIKYLKVENQILRSKLEYRVPVTDKERRRLGELCLELFMQFAGHRSLGESAANNYPCNCSSTSHVL
jgi:hypothetical protein